MNLGVSSHFVQFDMLFVITAIDKAIKFAFTIPSGLPHAIFCTAFLKGLTRLPALATRYLVSFHL